MSRSSQLVARIVRSGSPLLLGGVLLQLTCAFGCDSRDRGHTGETGETSTAGSLFREAETGTLEGQVRWVGALPDAPPFEARANLFLQENRVDRLRVANPNAPTIESSEQGVGDAVVFLRGVDPARARAWHLPPVRVVLDDYRIQVRQGTGNSRTGFVRRGDEIEMVSLQERFHSLHASGAAFFTLPMPDANQPRTRRLHRCGIVELSSAAGYYWMRAYLFVSDHPYCTHTDAQGRFRFEQVPAGTYEVVCWLPNWREIRHDRDPETCLITRMTLAPPVEISHKVALTANETKSAQLEVRTEDFAPRP